MNKHRFTTFEIAETQVLIPKREYSLITIGGKKYRYLRGHELPQDATLLGDIVTARYGSVFKIYPARGKSLSNTNEKGG